MPHRLSSPLWHLAAGITKNEMVLWHQQYLACCVELNQWDTVVEYAKVTDNCPLQIDAMVQLHDWQTLKSVSLKCGPSTCMPSVHGWQYGCPSHCVHYSQANGGCECLMIAQMVLPKAQIEDSATATIVRAQMHLQELQVVDVDRICKQVIMDSALNGTHWCLMLCMGRIGPVCVGSGARICIWLQTRRGVRSSLS